MATSWKWECSAEIIEALHSVSETPAEDTEYHLLPEGKKLDQYLEFVSRVKANNIRREVKAADIKDNLDISHIDDITESDIRRPNRYKAALKLIGA